MLVIDGSPLTLRMIEEVANGTVTVSLSPMAIERMKLSRQHVETILEQGRVVYGVNTGFGKLSDITIPSQDVKALQYNLVRSHACGVGEPLSIPQARAMLLLRANVLAKGFSGARSVVAETLLQMLNHGVVPVIPARGSVGASGDLAPLAHLALVAVGEGEAFWNGTRMPGGQALGAAGISPVELEAKEGLALLNGTQAICAVGGLALAKALRLMDWATAAGSVTLEALLGTPAAFDSRIHMARNHECQQRIAGQLLSLLADSQIRESHREGDARVQDAYSLRCMPQVHGAALSALEYAQSALVGETGSATDNPLVFDNGDVISGGNFHGAPVALPLDFAAIAITDMASISERRIDRLVNPDSNEGLPAFLTNHPGIGSGFMIAHVTAAALLNECKVLSHPASIDSVPTSAGKEDHVSMGMTAAIKLDQIVEDFARVVAIELLAACEGIEYRRPLKAGVGVEIVHAFVRAISPRLEEDRALGTDIETVARAILSDDLPFETE